MAFQLLTPRRSDIATTLSRGSTANGHAHTLLLVGDQRRLSRKSLCMLSWTTAMLTIYHPKRPALGISAATAIGTRVWKKVIRHMTAASVATAPFSLVGPDVGVAAGTMSPRMLPVSPSALENND